MTELAKRRLSEAPSATKAEKLRQAVDRGAASPDMMLETDKRGVLKIGFKHEDQDLAYLLLILDLGTTDVRFADGLAGQVACMGSHGNRVDEANSNFLLSVIRGVKPRDQLEAMLAAQMAAVHAATMMMARRLNHVENIPQQDAAERALNKLARTYAMQMEALKRYRTGGQQKVTVEHVTVNKGGQAIVGNVAHGGRGAVEK